MTMDRKLITAIGLILSSGAVGVRIPTQENINQTYRNDDEYMDYLDSVHKRQELKLKSVATGVDFGRKMTIHNSPRKLYKSRKGWKGY